MRLHIDHSQATAAVKAGLSIATYRAIKPPGSDGPAKIALTHAMTGPHDRVDLFIFPDAKTPFHSLIYDGSTGKSFTLFYQRRTVFERDASSLVVPGLTLDPTMRLTRRGEAKIVGLECTEWSVSDAKGGSQETCVASDGVVLRAQSPQLYMEAIDVAYGTLGPGLFNVPSDLQRLFAGPGPVAAPPPPKPLSSPPARP